MRSVTFDDAVHLTIEFFNSLSVPSANTGDSYDLLSPHPDPPLLVARGILMFKGWDTLVDRAKTDREVFEALRHQIADYVERRQELPDEAATWLVQHLTGMTKTPRKRSGRHARPDYLTIAIYQHTQTLESKGFRKTRAEETGNKTTAFDVIAEANARRGETPNDYGAVGQAYLVGKRTLSGLVGQPL